jgi:hypothetical protein
VTAPTNNSNPYGSFSVRVRKIEDNDGALKTVELYDNCNLNPNSENYVAKKIGDKYIEWDEDTKRYIDYGNYDNNSQFIRIEMNLDVDDWHNRCFIPTVWCLWTPKVCRLAIHVWNTGPS